MSLTIREAATDHEWQEAMAVLHRVYVGEWDSTPERAATFYRREALEPEGALLIAVNRDGAVIGATLLLNEGSSLPQLARPGEREFRLLAVHPDARGSGAGAALVQTCIDRSIQARARGLVLWTRASMLPAQRLYERLGFVRMPERDQDDPRGFRRLFYRHDLRSC